MCDVTDVAAFSCQSLCANLSTAATEPATVLLIKSPRINQFARGHIPATTLEWCCRFTTADTLTCFSSDVTVLVLHQTISLLFQNHLFKDNHKKGKFDLLSFSYFLISCAKGEWGNLLFISAFVEMRPKSFNQSRVRDDL